MTYIVEFGTSTAKFPTEDEAKRFQADLNAHGEIGSSRYAE